MVVEKELEMVKNGELLAAGGSVLEGARTDLNKAGGAALEGAKAVGGVAADSAKVTLEGAKQIEEDPTAGKFPWWPATLSAADVQLLAWGCNGLARAALKHGTP